MSALYLVPGASVVVNGEGLILLLLLLLLLLLFGKS
jgi:hypothetical protein